MNNDLISRKELRKAFKKLPFFTGAYLYYARQLIDNAPTVSPKLSDEQIKKITDLLETEWEYEGIREDVSRILRMEADNEKDN